jgi:hypothetical protein
MTSSDCRSLGEPNSQSRLMVTDPVSSPITKRESAFLRGAYRAKLLPSGAVAVKTRGLWLKYHSRHLQRLVLYSSELAVFLFVTSRTLRLGRLGLR